MCQSTVQTIFLFFLFYFITDSTKGQEKKGLCCGISPQRSLLLLTSPHSQLHAEDVRMYPHETSANPRASPRASPRNLGHPLFSLPPKEKSLVRKLEKSLYKLNAAETAVTFDKICLKDGFLPNYYYYYYYYYCYYYYSFGRIPSLIHVLLKITAISAALIL